MQKPLLARTIERATHIPVIWVAVFVWLIILAGVYIYQSAHGVSLVDMLVALFNFLSTSHWGPLLYILAYTLQPLAFLPSTVFSVVAGSIFGFWPALIYTIVGANLSASLVYAIGHMVGRPLPEIPNRLTGYMGPLHRRPFETILFMRLAYFPFDVVNLFSGLLKLRYVPFMIATAVGSIPGIATLTSLGTSINLSSLFTEGISISAINMTTLWYSVILFVISISIAELVRRRQSTPDHSPS